MQTATDDRLLGRLLEGRYRLRDRIAHGGMSTVYRAVDERLDRDVAVKIMSAALTADPAFADRFAQEARVAARLSHPNAVSVYDQGTDGGHVFLVMELVRGQRTLRDLLREYGALTPALSVSVMQQVLAALAAAHRAGLVHRDVKPENILLSDDGAVKVADFGLARAIESELSSTRTGLMMGTVAYCPPEQLSRGAADARSDVYSAGIVLFELLAGSVPYTGDTPMAVAYQHVHSDVPAPSSGRPGIAWQLDELVRRATSRDPVGRQLDAGAFLAELHDVRMDLGLPAVAIPPRARSAPAAGPRSPAPAGATRVLGHSGGDTGRTERIPRTGNGSVAEGHTQPTPGAGGVHQTLVQPLGRGAPDSAGARPASPPSGSAATASVPGRTRRRRRRRAIVVTLIVLLLGAAAATGGWWLASGRYDRIPSVSGLPQGQATSTLREAGFKIDASREQAQFSETVPAGAVISTSPGASSRLVRGRTVGLVVSRGKERFTLPAVAGKTEAAARAALPPEANVILSKEYSDTVHAGLVTRTDPAASTQIKRGQNVTLYMSIGPPVLTVPDVSNFPQQTAVTALTKAGFQPVTTQDFSDTVGVGEVISETPTGLQSAVKGSTVSLVVSKGPEMVSIPPIPPGSDASAAQDELNGLGLHATIKKRHRNLFDFGDYENKVVSVDPPAGSSVRVGSSVQITAE